MTRLINKGFRSLLRLVFGFDRWHTSPLEERPYAMDIIQHCNARNERKSFVEIGCGLGDILRNVHFEQRIGLDMDEKVLRAARILPVSGKAQRIVFSKFQFPEDALDNQMSILTMVNWIHHVEPDVLKKKIEDYFLHNLDSGGEIIIDTVQDRAYRHNHQVGFLTKDLICSISRLGEYAREREVWAITKDN